MPLPRRPLFPAGNRLPVTVTDRKLVAELMDLQRGGCAAGAATLPAKLPTLRPAKRVCMLYRLLPRAPVGCHWRVVLARNVLRLLCLPCSPGECLAWCRAQAYVGTFLRRPTPAADAEDVTGKGAGTSGAPAEGAGEAADAAAGLYEVGTFCQVEMMAETDFGAQLLLQGHRRVRSAQQLHEAASCVLALYRAHERESSVSCLKAIWPG